MLLASSVKALGFCPSDSSCSPGLSAPDQFDSHFIRCSKVCFEFPFNVKETRLMFAPIMLVDLQTEPAKHRVWFFVVDEATLAP